MRRFSHLRQSGAARLATGLTLLLTVAGCHEQTFAPAAQPAVTAHSSRSPAAAPPRDLRTAPAPNPAPHRTKPRPARPRATHRPASRQSAHRSAHRQHRGEREVARGVILPDRVRTPGAIDRTVRQATIATTICRTGYTETVRPDSSYTTALKVRQLLAGYAFHGDRDTGDYEEDHLIPLELGGSPDSPRNLWPEPYAGRAGARIKDTLENALHTLVCEGSMRLSTAQRAIARNWWSAYRRYVVAGYVPHPPTSRPTARPAPSPAQHRPRRPATPPPPSHSCTTTSSGSCIRGGELCPQADYGQVGYDAEGRAYTCTGDTDHPHWE